MSLLKKVTIDTWTHGQEDTQVSTHETGGVGETKCHKSLVVHCFIEGRVDFASWKLDVEVEVELSSLATVNGLVNGLATKLSVSDCL